jgi:predicted double-glycine peptidase
VLVLGALSAGCASYQGTARSVAPHTLRADSGWQRVEGVPQVHQRGAKDCGAAALSAVLGYWSRPEPAPARAQIDAELRKSTGEGARDMGLSAGALRDYARRQGLKAYVFHGTFADLQHELELGRPVIVGVHKALSSREYLAHYEVVLGYHPARERVLTLDPAHGLREYPKQGFLEEWQRTKQTTLVVMP